MYTKHLIINELREPCFIVTLPIFSPVLLEVSKKPADKSEKKKKKKKNNNNNK